MIYTPPEVQEQCIKHLGRYSTKCITSKMFPHFCSGRVYIKLYAQHQRIQKFSFICAVISWRTYTSNNCYKLELIVLVIMYKKFVTNGYFSITITKVPKIGYLQIKEVSILKIIRRSTSTNHCMSYMVQQFKEKTKHPYLFQYKLSYRNETGINHHGLVSISV